MTFKSRFYDFYCSKWYDAELEAVTEPARQSCIEELRLEQGAAVLDLGCGTGLNLPFLAHAVGEMGQVVAVDASGKCCSKRRRDCDGEI